MATLGRALREHYPAVLFATSRRRASSGRAAASRNHNRLLGRVARRERHQDRLHPRLRLQSRHLGRSQRPQDRRGRARRATGKARDKRMAGLIDDYLPKATRGAAPSRSSPADRSRQRDRETPRRRSPPSPPMPRLRPIDDADRGSRSRQPPRPPTPSTASRRQPSRRPALVRHGVDRIAHRGANSVFALDASRHRRRRHDGRRRSRRCSARRLASQRLEHPDRRLADPGVGRRHPRPRPRQGRARSSPRPRPTPNR